MRTLICLVALLLWDTVAFGQTIAVRIPWDGVNPQYWPSVSQATTQARDGNLNFAQHQTGGDLVRLIPGQLDDVLVDSGEGGMIIDPQVDGAAEWAYYAKMVIRNGPDRGFDIFKVNLTTREEVRLTHSEWTPSRAIPYGPTPFTGVSKGWPVNNICPMVVGNQVIFCSNRDGYRENGISPQAFKTCYLIYTMDTDGKNMECINPWALGSALHPELNGKTGRVLFSIHENMAGRDDLAWSVWEHDRAGQDFAPLQSGYATRNAKHFHAIGANGKLYHTGYYAARNGAGTIVESDPFATGSPAPAARFFSPVNQAKVENYEGREDFRQVFMTQGTRLLTNTAHSQDSSSWWRDGQRGGFFTHPSPLADGLLATWTGPEAPLSPSPSLSFMGRGRIVKLPYSGITSNSQITIVKDDPAYSYIQPRAVATHEQIFGQPVPITPWPKNDGTACPAKLPKGTPFALIGSASSSRPEFATQAQNGSLVGSPVPGADVGFIRLYAARPSPQFSNAPDFEFRSLIGDERLDILADIPVSGRTVLDGDGNPDTSWAALVPGKTSITQVWLDRDKNQVTRPGPWKGFRPGEVAVKCGNCHLHTQAGTPLDSSLLGRYLTNSLRPEDPPFEVVDATHPRTLQLERDVQPILTQHGLTAVIDRDLRITPEENVIPGQARVSPLMLTLPAAVTAEQRALLRDWIDSGAGQMSGILKDDTKPVLTVQEPSREQHAPITAIRFGAYDVHSGIDPAKTLVTASFSVQGRPAGTNLADLFSMHDHVYEIALPQTASGEVSVTVGDVSGNVETLVRTFAATTPPDPPLTLKQQILLKAQQALERIQANDPTGAEARINEQIPLIQQLP